ncbi:MAG: peptidoglycan bridge formation glycyltransferase FemA/FemB family protein [Anaerolineae bacterium]|nr:peptidoglycan bridge formation glycyltransferase FemA/FemB family protein [Anaerolineae bacterium]
MELSTVISKQLEDHEWDQFVAATTGGHYSQTSLWARVKMLKRWEPLRIKLFDGEHLIAGAQILMRPLPVPFLGKIAYLSKGPLFANGREQEEKIRSFIRQIILAAKQHGITVLFLQPPNNGTYIEKVLPSMGFFYGVQNITPPGTVLIDLQQELDVILAKIRPSTRRNIRHSKRDGIQVRIGSSKEDLDTFYHLLSATAERQQFEKEDKTLFEQVWKLFAPHQWVQFAFSEYQGEAVSTVFAFAFGDTVTSWRGGWSGKYRNYHPNDAVYWGLIEWAKQNGYRYMDMGGIQIGAAQALLSGKELPDYSKDTFTSFKTGFGGEVVIFPQTYGFVHCHFLAKILQVIVPKVADSKLFDQLVNILSR